MTKFLRAAFNTTPFQILMIFTIAGIKYAIIKFNLVSSIQTSALIVLLISVVIFITVIGFKGIIENREESFESWAMKDNTFWKKRFLVSIITWSRAVAAIILFLFAAYFFIPTTLYMFIALFAGIVIRNCFDYFIKKDDSVTKGV